MWGIVTHIPVAIGLLMSGVVFAHMAVVAVFCPTSGSCMSDGRSPRTALQTALLLFLPLCVLLIWMVPRGFELNSRLLGHPQSDLMKHYWNLWWFQQTLWTEHRLPLGTELLNFPVGLSLYPIEPINGILATVLVPLLGLPLTTNLLAIANLWLGCLGMGALIHQLTGRLLPAGVAGLLYGLGSYALWTVYVGVGELSHLGFLPMALRAFLRAFEQPSWKRLLALTLWCFLTGFSCWYYALFLVMGIGVLLLGYLPKGVRSPGTFMGSAVAAGLGIALLFPLMGTFNASYAQAERSSEPLQAFVEKRLHVMPHDPPFSRLDPVHLVAGGAEFRAEALRVPYAGGRYIGGSLLLLSLLGLLLAPLRSLPWLLLASSCLVLGMGSRLVVAGLETSHKLPFQLFNLVLERYAQPMNFPARFMMPLSLSLVVMSGLGLWKGMEWLERRNLAASPRRHLALSGLVCALGLSPLLETRLRGDLPLPLPGRNLEPWTGAAFLATAPDTALLPREAVLELPQLFQGTNRMAYDSVLLMQTVHARPTALLPIDRIDNFSQRASEQLRQNALLGVLALEVGLPGLGNFPVQTETPTADGLERARLALKMQGFGALVITWHGLPSGNIVTLSAKAEALLGPPLFQDRLQSVYSLARAISP